jgi:hypothetical protein
VDLAVPFMYAPGRWETVDGWMPVKVLWVYWQALQMGHAATALATAHGIGLAMSDGHEAARAREEALATAFPLETTEH